MNLKESSSISGDIHLVIRGRVQGVGYRDGMMRTAIGLGVQGWVRNRRDGSVEAVLRGDKQACEAVIRWAHRGPGAAQVEKVEQRPATKEESAEIRATFRWRETA
jgi:acylphosphatase